MSEFENMTIFCLWETQFKCSDINRLKSKMMRKLYYTIINQKKAGVTITRDGEDITQWEKGQFTKS